MDQKKVRYVTRGNNKRKASNSKTQVSKRKGHSRGKNLESIDVQDLRDQEANEELIDHEQEDLPKDEDVLASINTSIVNTSITSTIGPNVIALNGDNNKKIGEELRCANLLVDPLSPYSFVR